MIYNPYCVMKLNYDLKQRFLTIYIFNVYHKHKKVAQSRVQLERCYLGISVKILLNTNYMPVIMVISTCLPNISIFCWPYISVSDHICMSIGQNQNTFCQKLCKNLKRSTEGKNITCTYSLTHGICIILK